MRALRRIKTSSSLNSSPPSSSSNTPRSPLSSSWIHLRSVLFVVASNFSPVSCSSPSYSHRGRLKSPWSRRKRKNILSAQQWRTLFTLDGKLRDDGVKFLKKVRSGGVDQSIRSEVWPFLLGVYDLTSSREERDVIRTRKRLLDFYGSKSISYRLPTVRSINKCRKEYEKLRRQCRRLLNRKNELSKTNESGESLIKGIHFSDSSDVTARESLSSAESFTCDEGSDQPSAILTDGLTVSRQTSDSNVTSDSESSVSNSSDNPESSQTFNFTESMEENDRDFPSEANSFPSKTEDFSTWQRIIRIDAIRANAEWMAYSPVQAAVSEATARHFAEVVGLKDYNHLEPARIFHAARLVAILEAYALYDPEIGYCQGMSDLLSPIITVITEDDEAFWCFVSFMKKARHNFRLDELGIRRQLNIVSKIIKYKDSHLYKHLEELQAEDCFFVYRMVVVLFRRELTFEQTLCLWEVMWADQAAIRAGVGKFGWSRIRQRAPPTDDLLLYAIAASVLQRRKLIIEKYSSMDEILRECNAMAGHLDVWKLLDDAHNLVVTLHDKIETPF